MKRILRGVLFSVPVLLVALLLTGVVLRAQTGSTAQITGTVRDSSGGVLPGADVTATQTETGFKRTVVTESNGGYTLSNLPIGPYRLEVSLSGFRSYARTGIVLQVNSNPVLDVALQLGDLAETVTVAAAAPLVETRNPGVGTVIENERIEELPLNGRNVADLVTIAGAAVRPEGAAGSSSSRSFQGDRGGAAIAVAGGLTFGVAFVLDGAVHNNPYDNLNLPLPFPDAIEEFRVETSALNAQNGFHSGAAVNGVTKSGTNSLHGDLFEFSRNHRFNATSPFAAINPATGKRRDDGLNRNQFGGTLGGPIVKDKMFFFGAYQGTRTAEAPADLISFIPTAAMLAGDFTQVASAACNTRGAITLGGGFVNNQINPSLLSPAAVAIAKKLPTTTDPCGRITYSRTRNIDEKQAIAKVDYQFTQNHSIFGRYMATTFFYEPPLSETPDNILVTTVGGRDNLAQSLAFGDTQVLSNATVNAIRFAYNRTGIHRTHTDFFSFPDVGVNMYSYLPHYSLLAVTGGFNLGGGTENDATFKTNSYAFSDDLTLVRGNHQWGMGATFSMWDSLSRANVRSPGTFSFDGGVTGLGLADFLIGRPFTLIQSAPNTLDMKQNYFGTYIQDTWRVSNRVTLNYGVRWDPYFPQQLVNGAIYNFSPEAYKAGKRSTVFPGAPPGFTYPGDAGFPNGQAGVDKQWATFGPRVSMAWDPTGDGKTSIRAAYGLGSEFTNGQFYINTSNAPPWGSEVRLTRPNIGSFDNPFQGIAVPNIFPITFDKNAPFSLNGPYLVPPSDLKTTHVHSWNVSVQRQFGADLAVSASYLGNRANNLWDVVTGNPGTIPGGGSATGPCTINTVTGPQTVANCSTASLDSRRELTQVDPNVGRLIGFLDYFTDHGYQKYNGMLLSVQKRAGDGYSVNANYTLSKCEGLPTQGGTTPNVASGYSRPVSLINPPSDADARLDADLGPCDTDRRHIFNLSMTATTPNFAGAASVLSDWRLSGVFRASSGSPFSVTTGLDRALTGNPGVQRASVAGDPYLKTGTTWLNPASFSQPALGTFGNSGRNQFYGPGAKTVDLSLVRSFRFAEGHRVEARLEAFNAFNWVRLNNPTSAVNNANFGKILGSSDPRIMQFALKYTF
jgi:hypothetical protein